MKCDSCHFENPAGMRFCGGCGAKLALGCSSCGQVNPPEHRFCGNCGAPVSNARPSATTASPSASSVVPAGPRSELRQVTVMFCDIVGSTRLSVRLDPETYRDVLAAFRELCVGAARHMGGDVARYLGDGLLIAFGWPTAWEDDTRRAVRTALAIRDGLPALSLPSGAEVGKLEVRIGIHTGLVIAGDLSAGDRTEHDALLGDTPNIAARIQVEAEPGQVLISGTTSSLIQPYFVLERLGRRELRGLDEDVEIVLVHRESGIRDRIATVDPHSPVLGRQQEISLLLDRWTRASVGSGKGQGDAALLIGEPGIGKSRVTSELRRLVAAENLDLAAEIISIGCSAYDTTSALRPFVEALELDTGFSAATLSSENAGAFAAALARRGMDIPMRVAAIASLFDKAALYLPEWTRLSPERKRAELFEALTEWVLAGSPPRPLLVVVEDVHWADESTLALLGHLIERLGTSSALLVMTARPEFQPSWPSRLRVTQIALQRLGPDEGRRLVEAAGGGGLSSEDVERIVARAEGVPLFIEELVRELKTAPKRGTGPAAAAVPATLRDLLMARLDRVREARPLLEIGALLGKTFAFGLLAAVSGQPETELERQLGIAADAEFLEVRGVLPLARLGFRHALIQEAVQESILRQRRVELHGRIARALSTTFPELIDRQPEVYAAHCAAAGLWPDAIAAWQRAARRATERSAYAEAAQHYREAVAAAFNLPESAGRYELELSLQVALGAQMIAARGNAAPEVEAAYRRAEALCLMVNNAGHQFRALRGLLTFFMVRGRPKEAERIGEKLLALAEQSGDPGVRLQVYRPLGLNLLYLGRFEEALRHLDRALALHDAVAHADHRHEYGSDPAVLAFCNRGWIRWFMGDADGAVEDCEAAIARAKLLDHPHSQAFALSFLASVHQGRREPARVRDICAELHHLAHLHAFPYWATWERVLSGWARAQDGETSDGCRLIADGLDAYRATGAELMVPYFAALLGEACLLNGDAGRGRKVLDDGIGVARQHSIAFYAPELLRLRSRASEHAARQEARSFATEAATWSRTMKARTLELRASIELARLEEGRSASTLREIAELRASIQGTDLIDLAEADALIGGS
jgi:class 3 adenylate cyclase/tetratricopeptide (TPR) repeat protein